MNAEVAYLFRHALLRDAAYQLQLPTERAELHRLSAHLIEQLFCGESQTDAKNPSAEIAQHLRAARELSGNIQWLEQERRHTRLAAEAADREFDGQALVHWCALAEIGDPATRAFGLRRACAVALRRGQVELARTLAAGSTDAAANDVERRVDALCAQGQVARHAGCIEEASQCFEAAAELAESAQSSLLPEVLGELGWLHDDLGDIVRAIAEYERAISLYRAACDEVGEGKMLCNLATLHRLASRHAIAEQLYRQSLALFRKTGARNYEAVAEAGLGATLGSSRGDEVAAAHERAALALFRDVGARSHEGVALANLAGRLAGPECAPERLRLASEALAIQRETGNRYGEALALRALGRQVSQAGRIAEGLQMLQEALAIHQAMRDIRNEAQTHFALGAMAVRANNESAAQHHYDQALVIARQLGDDAVTSNLLFNVGNAHLHAGRLDQAETCYLQALEAARKAARFESEADALANLSEVLRRRGRLSEALERIGQASEIYRRLGEQGRYGESLCGLACALVEAGRLPEAHAAWHQGAPLCSSFLGQDRFAYHRQEMERTCKAAGVAPLEISS